MLSFILIFIAVLAAVIGQICLKHGLIRVGALEIKGFQGILTAAQRVLAEPAFVAGLVIYLLVGIIWLVVLSKRDVGYAYPLLALTYAFMPAAAYYFLGESIPGLRWAGIVFVIIGVVIIAMTGKIN